MVDYSDAILKFISSKGPSLPIQISKHVGKNLLLSSAMLSELSSKKKLKVSTLKVGSSPLYYVSGQEFQLQKYADNLGEKEKIAYDLLMSKKVLRDTDLMPIMRLCMRNIKDFAHQLNVTIKDTKEVFWKWYLTNDTEAERLIKDILGLTIVAPVEERIVPVVESEKTEFVEKKIRSKKVEVVQQKIIKKRAVKKKKELSSNFLTYVHNYFKANEIKVTEQIMQRKDKEYDFVIEVTNSLGVMTCYCKAVNKKRIDERDLSLSMVQGQLKRLPTIFITFGIPTKRAKEMLRKELKAVTFKSFN
jgi:hypothetical protein